MQGSNKYADLQSLIAQANAREAALREVFGLVRAVTTDVQPVLDAVARHATHLCDASFCNMWRLEGDTMHHAAIYGFPREELDDYLADFPAPIQPDTATGQVYATGTPVHLKQVGGTGYRDRKLAETYGFKDVIGVPVPADDGLWGVIVLGLREAFDTADDQIALVQAFAEQAGVAIQNAAMFQQSQDALARQTATAEVLSVISQSRDDEKPVFDAILQNAARLCQASDAALLLGRPDEPNVTLAALLREDAPRPEQNVEVIAETNRVPMKMDPAIHTSAEAICLGTIVHILDLSQSVGYQAGEPSFRSMVDDFGIRTCLSVPLFDGQGALGAINLHRRLPKSFSEDEIALVKSFAAQAVIAIENVRQFKALETLNAELGDRVEAQVGEIERMGKLKRFLPTAVADTVVSSGSENLLKSHRALLGVLFCDIRGFTAFCETAEPEETIEFLQTYHEEMGKLINAHGAGVDHRMGDGIMVLFNDPLPCDDPAGDAVCLAIAMRARMSELSKDWKRMGFRLGFGVGVSLGYATVGMVGYEDRSDYTASGTAINVASRLCEMAEDGEILLSTRAAIAVEDDYTSVSTGEVTLKGIREPIEVLRLAESADG